MPQQTALLPPGPLSLWEAVLTSAPVGVLVLDGRDLRVRLANPAYQQLLEPSFHTGSLVGRTLAEFLPDAESSGLAESFRRVARTGEPLEMAEQEHRDPARGTTWWRWSLRALPHEPGNPTLLLVVTEVTGQVRERRTREQMAVSAEAERQRLRAILDGLADGVAVTDATATLTWLNPEARRIYGLSATELPSLEQFVSLFDMQGPDNEFLTPLEWPLARVLRGETFHRAELRVTRRGDGRQLVVQYSGTPLRDGEGRLQLAVLSMRDVTDQRQAEQAARDAHARLADHVENSPLAVVEWDHELRVTRWSSAAEGLFGWRADEVRSRHPNEWAFVHPDDQAGVYEAVRRLYGGDETRSIVRNRNLTRDGKVLHCEWYNSAILDAEGRVASMLSFVSDGSERQHAADLSRFLEGLSDRLAHLRTAEAMMAEATRSLGEILGASRCLLTEVDVDQGRLTIGPHYASGLPDREGKYALRDLGDAVRQASREGRTLVVADTVMDRRTAHQQAPLYDTLQIGAFISVPLLRQGRWIASLSLDSATPREWRDDEVALVEAVAERTWPAIENARLLAVAREALAARDLSLRQLQRSEERHRTAVEAADLGTWYWDLGTGELLWSDRCKGLFGLDAAEAVTYPRFLEAVLTDDRTRVHEAILRSIETLEDIDLEYRARWPDGSVRWLQTKGKPHGDAQGRAVRVQGVVQDVTERKRTEEALLAYNAELEQFAYVASHDLQEPLRTVTSYAQLLARRYRGQLDGDADEFIAYITEGAQRMSSLIQDLLAYSRATRSDESRFVPVDLGEALDSCARTLRAAMEESGAVVRHDGLPTVAADPSQVQQLFQNLVGNAIKYRHPERTPVVTVAARRAKGDWLICVQDNGQGFEPHFAERIFGLFKRLHGRQVPGTGIGLSICRKIVERHGGRIWAEGRPGDGATFWFTLPA